MEPGAAGSSSASFTGDASSCITWPWKGISSVKGTQVTPLYSLRPVGAGAFGVAGRHEVADAHGEDDLRLVVEVAAEGVGTDAGGPEQLRRAQGVGGDDDESRADLVALARAPVGDHDARRAAVLDQHPRDERLVEQGEVRVARV